MASVVLDYTFKDTSVANPDGTFVSQLPSDAQIVPWSGGSIQGQNLLRAVVFGPSGPLEVDLSNYAVDTTSQFHARVVFIYGGTNPPPSAPYPPRIILQSNFIPFSLNLVFRDGKVWLQSQVSVTGPSTRLFPCATQTFSTPQINPGVPYAAELVWDSEKGILVTFLNGIAISSHGCGPSASVQPPRAPLTDKTVFIGGPKGPVSRSHFLGSIAAVQIELAIPGNLTDQVAQQKQSPQWYITTKLETLRPNRDFGQPGGPIVQQDHTSTQQYTAGAISYHPPLLIHQSSREAFELHGVFWNAYKNLPDALHGFLGYQTSDEAPWNEGGVTGRRVRFSNGQLEASDSPNPDDVPIYAVAGEIWKARRSDGGLQRWGIAIGLQYTPLPDNVDRKDVIMQRFEHGSFYQKDPSTTAWGLFGLIDRKYRDNGGPRGALPIGPEEKIHGITTVLGLPPNIHVIELDVRKSPLSYDQDIYWSSVTGAHFVSGDIRQQWINLGGPTGFLGLPTSDRRLETRTEYQDFQHGMAVVEHTMSGNVRFWAPRAFKVIVDMIGTGWPPDPTEPGDPLPYNDVYINIQIEKRIRGTPLGTLLLDQRYPDGSDGKRVWKDSQIFSLDPPVVLPPLMVPAMGVEYVVKVRVYDEDKPPSGNESRDTLIGEGSFTLNYQNVFMLSTFDANSGRSHGSFDIKLSDDPTKRESERVRFVTEVFVT
ncbi:uncharacterized protein BDR25DRAFT_343511 [Lindgomyces ingoldianus]|uniref:Uncharacterized protein n=1 Tax=Lindgomyces ingoldianus TaxID=673940 RepID=A0ACB6QS64_9PLEO|nr:uncharacterized protein BDR25DRAFT_343511 [Lindgomyces ingoldianus]KAF2469839.1 hypothetical protein BDR25DRAFT_343511 [Lindgomyces ingoldianus]